MLPSVPRLVTTPNQCSSSSLFSVQREMFISLATASTSDSSWSRNRGLVKIVHPLTTTPICGDDRSDRPPPSLSASMRQSATSPSMGSSGSKGSLLTSDSMRRTTSGVIGAIACGRRRRSSAKNARKGAKAGSSSSSAFLAGRRITYPGWIS